MSKPRNKTNRRRLHYLGVLAAAGLLTSTAAAPVMAQNVDVDPSGNIAGSVTSINNPGAGNSVTVAGESTNASGVVADVDWTAGDIDGDLIFGPMVDQDATPAAVGTKVTTSAGGNLNIAGGISQGNAEGAEIALGVNDNLTVGGNVAGGTGLVISGSADFSVTGNVGGVLTVDNSGDFTVDGDAEGTITVNSTGTNTIGTLGTGGAEATTLNANQAVGISGNIGNGTTATTINAVANVTQGVGGTVTGDITVNATTGTVGFQTLTGADLDITGSGNKVTAAAATGTANSITGGSTDVMNLTAFGGTAGGDAITVTGATLDITTLTGGTGADVTTVTLADADASLTHGGSGTITVGAGNTAINSASDDVIDIAAIVSGTNLVLANTNANTGNFTVASVASGGEVSLSGKGTIASVAGTATLAGTGAATQAVITDLEAGGTAKITGAFNTITQIDQAAAGGTFNIQGTGGAGDAVAVTNAIGAAAQATAANIAIGGAGDTTKVAVTAGNIVGGNTAVTKTAITVADGSSIAQGATDTVTNNVDVTTTGTGSAALGVIDAGATVTLTGGAADAITVAKSQGTVTAKNAKIDDLTGGSLTVVDADTVGNINGAVSVKGDNAGGADALTVTGQIGSLAADAAPANTVLTIGGTNADLTVTSTAGSTIVGDAAYSTQIINQSGSAADFSNSVAKGTQITLTNNNAALNSFKIGQIGDGTTTTGVTVAGAVTGTGDINKATVANAAGASFTQTAGKVIGTSELDNSLGTAMTVAAIGDGLAATNVTVKGTVSGAGGIDTATVTNAAGASFTQTAGAVIGTSELDNSLGTVMQVAAIGDGATATNVTVKGTVTGAGDIDTATVKTNAAGDSYTQTSGIVTGTTTLDNSAGGTMTVADLEDAALTVDGTVTAGTVLAGTSSVVGKDGSGNTLTLNDINNTGATSLTVGDGTNQIAAKIDSITGNAVNGATINVNGADATLTNKTAGYTAIAGKVGGTISNGADVTFDNADAAASDFTFAATGGGKVALDNDISDGSVTVSASGTGSTSTLKDVSGGVVSNNASAGGQTITGDVTGGTVTANAAGIDSKATVGAISGAGASVTSTASTGGEVITGAVSNGAALTITAGAGSTATVGNPAGTSVDNATITALADGGTITMGDIKNVDGTTNTASLTAKNGGAITAKDIIDSVIDAATDDGLGSSVTVADVKDSTVNAIGNVITSGTASGVSTGIAAGTTVQLKADYTGSNYFYAIDGKGATDPLATATKHNAIFSGTIGDVAVSTTMTFGGDKTSAVGPITVTDVAGGSIVGGGTGVSTTINVVAGTSFNLVNTDIDGGNVALNNQNTGAGSVAKMVVGKATNGAVVTAFNATLSGLDGSELVVVTNDVLTGDVTGNSSIKGNNDATDDVLTLQTATIGGSGLANSTLTIGGLNADVSVVDDDTALSTIKGAVNAGDTTAIVVASGSSADLANTDLDGGSVALTNNNTGAGAADKAKLGRLDGGVELTVSGQATVAGTTSKAGGNVIQGAGGAGDAVIVDGDIDGSLTAGGGTAGSAIALTGTAATVVANNVTVTDGSSVDFSGGTVENAVTLRNNNTGADAAAKAKLGNLDGATLAVGGEATIAGTALGSTGNVVKSALGGGSVVVTGSILGDLTVGGVAESIAATGTAATVVSDDVTVVSGSSVDFSDGTVDGTVLLTNNNAGADAATKAKLGALDGAGTTLSVAGAGTITGTTAAATGSTVKGGSAGPDSVVVAGSILSGLTIGGAGISDDIAATGTTGTVIAADVTLEDGSTADFGDGTVSGTVALTNNTVGADNSEFVAGKAVSGAIVTAKNVTLSGLEGATLISDGSSTVKNGAITGTSAIEAKTGGDKVIFDTVVIGDATKATDLTIGDGALALDLTGATPTSIVGATSDVTKITLADKAGALDWNGINLASGGNVSLVNQTGTTDNFKIGTVSNDTVLTAQAMNIKGMAGGTLVVDGKANKLNGTVTGDKNVIYGKSNTAGTDVLTVDNTLTIGDNTAVGTSLVVGKAGTLVEVTDGGAGTNIVGATGAGVTSIKAIEGSIVDFGGTNLADGNFAIGTDAGKGSQMTVGDLGGAGVTTNVTVDGAATAGTIAGTETNKTTIKADAANGGTLTADIAATDGNVVYVDGNGQTMTVVTDSIGDTGLGSKDGVTVNLTGDTQFNNTGGTGNTTLDGKVTINAGTGTDVKFGAIDNNNGLGAGDDDITLNADAGKITVGDISNGATVTADATGGGKVTIEDDAGDGTGTAVKDSTIVATAGAGSSIVIDGAIDNATAGSSLTADGAGATVTAGDIIDTTGFTITADHSGVLTVHDIDNSTVTAKADNNGKVNINDVVNGSVVTADGSNGGQVIIHDVNASTVNGTGDVFITGDIVSIQVQVNKDTVVTLDGTYTGPGNNVYGVPDGSDALGDWKAVLTGQIGDGTAATEMTFGTDIANTADGTLLVEDQTGAKIVGVNGGLDQTVVNVVNGTIANLANTTIEGGNVALNVEDTATLTVGNVVAQTGNPVHLEVSNTSTATDALKAGNLAGTDTETSTVSVTAGTFAAKDVSGDWGITANAAGASAKLDRITGAATDVTLNGANDGTKNSIQVAKVDGGATVTAKNASIGALNIGTLIVNDALSVGDIYGTGNTIKGNGVGGPDTATVTGDIGLNAGLSVDPTTLVIGGTGESVSVVGDGANHTINGGTDGTTITIADAGSSMVLDKHDVDGNVTIVNNLTNDAAKAVVGTLLDGSVLTVDGQATAQTVAVGKSATVRGFGGADDEVHIAELTGGAINQTALTVGGGTGATAIAAILDGNLTGNAAGVKVTATQGSTFSQSDTGTASGLVVADNKNLPATADDLGRIAAAQKFTLNTLNNAQVTVANDGAVAIRGVSGTGNSLSGNGVNDGATAFVYMGDSGDGFALGSELAVNDATLKVAGDNANLNLNKLNKLAMNSTNGRSKVDVTEVANGGAPIQMNAPQVAGVGNNNVVFAAKDVEFATAFVLDSTVFSGTGHVVFDASEATAGQSIDFANGMNVTAGAGKTIDFIGNTSVDTAAANNLQIGTVNIVDGTFAVANGPLQLNNTTLNLTDDVAFDFGGGQGFTQAAAVNTGAAYNQEGHVYPKATSGDKATVAFANSGDFMTTSQLNVVGDTVFGGTGAHGAVTVTGSLPTAAGSGLYAKNLNVQSQMTMKDTLTVAAGASPINNPAINFDINDDYPAAQYPDGRYRTAIVMDAGSQGSSIAAGTYFTVDVAGASSQQFQTIGYTQAAVDANSGTAAEVAAMWQNLNFDGVIYDGTAWGGAAAFYNKGNGRFTVLSRNDVNTALTNGPGFGRPYINALMHYNPVLADYFGNGLFGAGSTLNPFDQSTADPYREITAAMGNTLSAALMMNGARTHFNNLHPRFEEQRATSAGEMDLNGLWATGGFTFVKLDEDFRHGYDGFDARNYGVTIGYDRWLSDQFRLGAYLGFNNGKLDGDYQTIDSDDVQLGIYAHAELDYGVDLNVAMAYGWQSYDADRRVVLSNMPAANQKIKSDFDGNTFGVDLSVSRTFGLDYGMFVRPTFGYTYLGTELDSYRERSTLASTDYFNLAQKVSGTDFDLHLFRLGTDIGWACDNATVIGRAYYVGNAGDDQPKSRAYLTGSVLPSAATRSFNIYGAKYDKNMANLGLTLKVAPADNAFFAIDYDALLGSNSTSHNVNLSYKYEF